MAQLRHDALNLSHEQLTFDAKIKQDVWYKQTAWILHAMHYPHSFNLAAAGYHMCPWSGAYPDKFLSAAMQKE